MMALERHVTTRQVRQKVNAYLRGDVSLAFLRSWIVSATATSRLAIVYEVKTIVNGYMTDQTSEFDIKAALRKL